MMNDGWEDAAKSDLRRRTIDFAVRVVRFCAKLPGTCEAAIVRRQLVRSGTSPGAHYREACRARSRAEFISKMEGGLQELDETQYWLEVLVHADLGNVDEARELWKEADELIRMFVPERQNGQGTAIGLTCLPCDATA
jgi:four helix bundle protein